MFVVTIEQEEDDDFFGHWILRAAYILEGTDAEQAMYEALHRWVKDWYHGDRNECLLELGIEDNSLRVTVSYGKAPGIIYKTWQERFIPLDAWAGGRCVSKAPVHCAICGWYGAMKQMTHGYRLTSMGEIEPADYCPQCRAVLCG